MWKPENPSGANLNYSLFLLLLQILFVNYLHICKTQL